jgi:hypothetical protein
MTDEPQAPPPAVARTLYALETGEIEFSVRGPEGVVVFPDKPGFGWVDGEGNAALHIVAEVGGVPTIVDRPAPSPGDLLAVRRQRLRAFRRAFRAELQSRPVTEIPVLAAAVPNAPHLLAAADAFATSLDPYTGAGAVWRDVTEFLRAHPDMALFTAPPPFGFGVSDEWLDDLFEQAMAREA